MLRPREIAEPQVRREEEEDTCQGYAETS